jgi:hypothetical protein
LAFRKYQTSIIYFSCFVKRTTVCGLPSHILCPLCATADKTLDHLSLHYVFSRAIWAGLIATLRLPNFLPDDTEGIKDRWCRAAALFTSRECKKINSLIMLSLRYIWLERNARVFVDNRIPIVHVLGLILDEWLAWMVCKGGLVRDIH